MAEHSAIQWTNHTWNPWHGCHKVSPGCAHCYMFQEKKQYGQDPNLVVKSKTKFNDPLKWKDPALVFTCSWSDWFIEEADEWRDEAWGIIRRTPLLTYQILTKRIERAIDHLPPDWPLKNVWLGVSVENQHFALERLPRLLTLPAHVRFVSAEPLLGPVDLTVPLIRAALEYRPIHWLIIGGESGPKARPMDVEWARSLLRQCRELGIAPFVKQIGAKPFDSKIPVEVEVTPTKMRALSSNALTVSDRKGGDPFEWPMDLRVREFPSLQRKEAMAIEGF